MVWSKELECRLSLGRFEQFVKVVKRRDSWDGFIGNELKCRVGQLGKILICPLSGPMKDSGIHSINDSLLSAWYGLSIMNLLREENLNISTKKKKVKYVR